MRIALSLLLILLTAVPSLGASRRVPWLEDIPWNQVVSQARTAPVQPILIDFYAQWCRPCKMLDVMVYNESEVITELSDVLTFKVDIDKPEYRELKEQFNIKVLPTLIWLDERGRELDRFTGYQNKDQFLEIIRSIRTGGNTFFRIVDLQNARPEDPGLLFDLARRHAERGDLVRAEILYRRLMDLRFREDKSVVVDGMLGLATMEQTAGRREQAVGLARRASTAFRAEDEGANAALMAVAEFQLVLGDTTGSLATYRTLIQFDDTDFIALDGFVRMAVLARRDLEQATKYGLRAVIMSDSDPRMMASLARCYAQRDYFQKAKRWMGKALKADPENSKYAKQLAEYQSAMKKSPYQYRGRRR